jgi:non-specific serine/threonine protein kinase/serine/threonine-protein kinase
MTPEHWQRVEALFHAALERDAEFRDAFLRDACAGDESLLHEVRKLVESHQPAQRAIRTAAVRDAVQNLAVAESTLPTGSQIGAYRVIREIGRGGMGTVFLAERADEQFEKQVAIKLIRRGMDTESIIRHFRNERQILASLEHPNVARLIDGGTTEDGLPYVVMEYVEGQAIDEYCAANNLSVTERLELFRKVCSAVSYAHQHLVVHRDIKPSNILVTRDGVPKLLDFGIARLLEVDSGPSATMTGTRLMTPEYASPEQVRGEHATTLTDVYSLGVVLYELLTGVRPYRFRSDSPLDIAEAICHVEPARPSTAAVPQSLGGLTGEQLRKRLRGDLDNIVLTALRKEPERRYESVERFSDDVRKHLESLPIAARPDTWGYRTAKFVRRNRVGVVATAALSIAIIAGITTAMWEAHRARIQQGRAERRFNEVRNLARTVLFDYHDAIKNLPGATPVRERLVKDALQYLDSLASEAGGDPTLQRELAGAYERVSEVQGGTMSANLGNTAGAIESAKKALRIREELLRADPEGFETRRDVAASYYRLGWLLWETGDMGAASSHLGNALRIRKELTDANPSQLALRKELGATYDRVGMVLLEQGDAEHALENHRKELEILTSLPREEQAAEDTRRRFSISYEHIGSALQQMNDLPGALENNGKALAIRAALSADFPLNADHQRTLLVSYYNQGEILSLMRRWRDALDSYRKDLELARKLFTADPKNEQYRGDLAYALVREGDMMVRLGDPPNALVSYRKSEALRAADVQADSANLWKRSSLIEARAKICKTLAKSADAVSAAAQCEATFNLMQATTVDATNAAFRSFFADTYADLGEAFAVMAEKASLAAQERMKRWQSARDMYQRSADIWQDMARRGILTKVDAAKPESAAREVARCNAALIKLAR